MSDVLRGLPAMHRLLEDRVLAPYEELVGRSALRTAIARELNRARCASQVPMVESLITNIVERLEIELAEELNPLINATGILLHTNLGRAPLAAEALAAAHDVGAGYSNIEYDIMSGERGSRYDRLTRILCELTGAQDALVVNNCAAAVLLILDTFARGAEAIVARNELIEIGGGFRLPDVLARTGARLVEVGTTNRVYLSDFAAALSARTALLVRSHASNFSMEGYIAGVESRDLVALGKRAGVAVMEDLGSGALVDLREYGLPHERTVQEAVADGVSLIAFSGDKLLGGPQAGIVVGSQSYIARLRSNPLLRALRTDKVTIALLSATLRLHRTKESRDRIPLYAMLASTIDTLQQRAAQYVQAVPTAGAIESKAYLGGGSLPSEAMPSIAVTMAGNSPGEVATRLRASSTPIVVRIERNDVLLDLRTIAPSQDAAVIAALKRIGT
ncbi:MAG: L-seryl-tRNA(Sec) selenium transferase [Candidatus Eremiobacteraeota bacterium]|nr:L-seryl-tRNA(Sec) selenium transferase [Candidatus Eremiobacteraeota bacterium]